MKRKREPDKRTIISGLRIISSKWLHPNFKTYRFYKLSQKFRIAKFRGAMVQPIRCVGKTKMEVKIFCYKGKHKYEPRVMIVRVKDLRNLTWKGKDAYNEQID